MNLASLAPLFAEASIDPASVAVASDIPRNGHKALALARVLARRSFPAGYWHARDIEAAIEVMAAQLADLGLDPRWLPKETLKERARADGDEDEGSLRRHEIGIAVRAVNAALAAESRNDRFFAFAEDLPDFETDEPVWLLLTGEQRDRLLALDVLHAPSGIEASYDGVAR